MGPRPFDPASGRGLIGTTEWRSIAPSRARHRPSNRGATIIDGCTSVSSQKQRRAMTQCLKALKLTAANRQNWRCCYCDLPMWDNDPNKFAGRYRLTKRLALGFKCTAEHLTARCEGGLNHADNIAAACLICNRRRHRSKKSKSPYDYRRHVQARLHKGKWHPHAAVRMNASSAHGVARSRSSDPFNQAFQFSKSMTTGSRS